MDWVKYDLKLFLHETSRVALEEFIPVFHRWIQAQCLDDLLIDVADYRHVHHGPGVVLVAHDAHYAMDMAEGKLGLLYSRRRETHASRSAMQSTEERLTSVFRAALTACQRLEAETVWHGRLRFRGDAFMLCGNDRLLAPHTPEAYAALQPYLASVLRKLYPDGDVEMQQDAQPASRLTVRIRATADADVTTLLTRLESNGSVQEVTS
jgi:hypothetical protein